MIEVSEEHLYVYAQASVTLFARLCADVLRVPLKTTIPERIIPLCAKPPKDLGVLFDAEFADIKAMVRPGSRKRLDARARLRSMAVLQASLDGKKSQASDNELNQIVSRINGGEDWRAIFPGVSTMTINPDGDGPGLVLRISRNQGEAVQLVKEGDPNASVIAVRRVNELDYYNLGLLDLSRKLGKSAPKVGILIESEGMRSDPEFYKEIKIGKSIHRRYSRKALEKLKERLQVVDLEAVWATHRRPNKKAR